MGVSSTGLLLLPVAIAHFSCVGAERTSSKMALRHLRGVPLLLLLGVTRLDVSYRAQLPVPI